MWYHSYKIKSSKIILTLKGSSLRANRDVLCSNVLISEATDVCESFLIPGLLLRLLTLPNLIVGGGGMTPNF